MEGLRGIGEPQEEKLVTNVLGLLGLGKVTFREVGGVEVEATAGQDVGDGATGMNQSFVYDDLDRLLQASGPYGTKTYAYDRVGNLTQFGDAAVQSWGSGSLDEVVSVQGSVSGSDGRMGQGFFFDGASQGRLTGSETLSPDRALTVEVWVRPLVLGGSFLISKAGAFAFPRILADGGVEAQLSLSSGGAVTVSAPAGTARSNLWQHFVFTWDGAYGRIYVNGQLKAQGAASGALSSSSGAVVVGGSGFAGNMDEVNLQSRAISAAEALQRYGDMPNLAPSQPLAPQPLPAHLYAGRLNVPCTFQFLAWDLDGDALRYRIDWGDGQVEISTPLAAGTPLQVSHAWSASLTYPVKVQAIQTNADGSQVFSATSPAFNFYVASSMTVGMRGILTGSAARCTRLRSTASRG
jgi:hypothetical protein